MRLFLLFISLLLHLSAFAQAKPDSVEVAASVEEQAEYPGGTSAFLMFFSKNLEASRMELDEMDRGCVKFMLSFVVLEDGSIKLIGMKKRGLTCEALRVMEQMKPWKPAMKSGKPVKCYYNFPMHIRIM